MEKRITEYTIVVEQQSNTFLIKTNELIRQGWQPQGGVSWYYDSENKQGLMSQAMVRYAE